VSELLKWLCYDDSAINIVVVIIIILVVIVIIIDIIICAFSASMTVSVGQQEGHPPYKNCCPKTLWVCGMVVSASGCDRSQITMWATTHVYYKRKYEEFSASLMRTVRMRMTGN